MLAKILGCGAAGGVPSISKGWGDCDPHNIKNKRSRTSIILQIDDTNILIDAGPDIREQLLNSNIRKLDAILFTHEHADHTHGIDELREINRFMKKEIPIYANKKTLSTLKKRFDYAFKPVDILNEPFFHPWLEPNLIIPGNPFEINKIKIIPFNQDHEWTTTLGFRINNFAYCTDVVNFFDSSFSILKGIEYFIVGCLSIQNHPSHANLKKVLDWVSILKPKKTILTHMATGMDYNYLKSILPENVEPGYDGMDIIIS